MRDEIKIPADRLERNPLITSDGYRRLMAITQHPHAPAWNYVVGDRIVEDDLRFVDDARRCVFEERRSFGKVPSSAMIEEILALRDKVYIFKRNIRDGLDIEKDWNAIATTSREDIAVRVDEMVPTDEPLDRMVVYDTSGTTGHPIVVPHHPRSVGMNHALIEYALERHGVKTHFGADMCACINIAAQAHTVVFPNVFSVWKQAGFAKVNLNAKCWKSNESAGRFFRELDPLFITGDPVSYAEMLKMNIVAKPKALFSTALELQKTLVEKLMKAFDCPVVNWYSTTETGQIAYSCPRGNGMHILSPDLFVEILDVNGNPVEDGKRGEIAVTGGRNIYLPLLRYRTGDFGSIRRDVCECGDPAPLLTLLDARKIVMYRAGDGSIVNPVDVSAALRLFPIVQHSFNQRADLSIETTLRPASGMMLDITGIKSKLEILFGDNIVINITITEKPFETGDDGRYFPWNSEIEMTI